MALSRTLRQIALGTVAAVSISPSVSAAEGNVAEAVAGEFVLQLRPQALELNRQTLEKKIGAKVIENIRSDILLVRILGGETKNQTRLLAALKENQLVKVVDPNFIYRMTKLPNDPDLSKAWGLKNTGLVDKEGQRGIPGIDIGAEAAWDITTGSKNVIVAVIDTGIDFGHSDLKAQAWTNEKEANGKPGVDDDGNGLVDDLHGYDFANNKGDSTDDNEHGTHCSGTIGAKGGDGKGISGVNWDVSLMGIKFLDKDGSGTLAGAIKSIDYARTMGAKIISASWGGGGASDLMKKAIEDANSAGVLFVTAAGNGDANGIGQDNDIKPNYPSNYPVDNILAVAAVDNRGGLATFSNYGKTLVHVAGPGVNVYSTIPGNKYESFSGTSMATPHVAGIAALLAADNPNMTHLQIKKRIIDSARPLYRLKDKVVSGGMADAYYALTGQTPPHDPNDPALLANSMSYTLSTDHPYKEGDKIEKKIQISGAKKVSVKFSKFETESAYDSISFFDGSGEYIGNLSGKQSPGVTSPLSFGDTIIMRFMSDETITDYGFDVEAVLYE